MSNNKLIRNIASIAVLAAGVGLAVGIPLGLYLNRDKGIDLGTYNKKYILQNQSKDQKITIDPTYDRKPKGMDYQWYIKVDNSNELPKNELVTPQTPITLSTDNNSVEITPEVDPLEGYKLVPNATEKDFIFTKEMMQLAWMSPEVHQNFSLKCKVSKGETSQITDEIKVFLPKQVISITQPMLKTFMYTVGSYFTSENIQTDIDQTTGEIKLGSSLFKKIEEYFLLNTEYPGENVFDSIKLSYSNPEKVKTNEQNPNDYIVDFDFRLKDEFTWIKTLYNNDETSSYGVNDENNVLHLDKVNIQQNLYTTTNITYTQDDLTDFVNFVNNSFTYSNYYVGNTVTLSPTNLKDPFTSLSINSQIPNPLNVIQSVDLTVRNQTNSLDNTFEFVFHINPKYKINVTAKTSEKASVTLDNSNNTLTISNIKLNDTNTIIKPSEEKFANFVGWNITKTSLDNVVNELVELYDGEAIPGDITSPIGISLRKNSNQDYFTRFANLLKINGLPEVLNLVDTANENSTLLQEIWLGNYSNTNGRKTIDVVMYLNQSGSEKYVFAKNGFKQTMDKNGIWYEYDKTNGDTLTIHNFPLTNFQVNNYWIGSYKFSEWITNYLNFNTTYKGLDLTNDLDDNFYQVLGIPKDFVKSVKVEKATDKIGKFNSLSIIVDKNQYYLENVENQIFDNWDPESQEKVVGYQYNIINNDQIQIVLQRTNIFEDSNQLVVNTNMESFIDSIKSKTSDSNVVIKGDADSLNFSVNSNDKYFSELVKFTGLNSKNISNFNVNLELNTDNTLNLRSIYINLAQNTHNFWITNPFYKKNNISTSGNNSSIIIWQPKIKTSWKFVESKQSLGLNSDVYNDLVNTLNQMDSKISIDTNDINILEDELNSLDIAKKFLDEAFGINTINPTIAYIELTNSDNVNDGLNITIDLNEDANKYKFVIQNNNPNFEVEKDGASVTIKNVKSTKIEIISQIDFSFTKLENNIQGIWNGISTSSLNDNKVISKNSSGQYELNQQQINAIKDIIQNQITDLKDVDFSVVVTKFENTPDDSNYDPDYSLPPNITIEIILPEGFIFHEETSSQPGLQPDNDWQYTFNKETPNKLIINQIELLHITYAK